MPDRYALTHNGTIIKRHPHRLTCIIEAIERGLVVGNSRWRRFVEGE